MVIIVDTCALLAYFALDDPNHDAATEVIDSTSSPLIVSPFVVAELGHLVKTRMGVRAELAMLEELGEGRYEHPIMGAADLIQCHTLLSGYPDQELGVTDISLVVLAERYRTDRILTFNRRHFSILRTTDGKPFSLLP